MPMACSLLSGSGVLPLGAGLVASARHRWHGEPDLFLVEPHHAVTRGSTSSEKAHNGGGPCLSLTASQLPAEET